MLSETDDAYKNDSYNCLLHCRLCGYGLVTRITFFTCFLGSLSLIDWTGNVTCIKMSSAGSETGIFRWHGMRLRPSQKVFMVGKGSLQNSVACF